MSEDDNFLYTTTNVNIEATKYFFPAEAVLTLETQFLITARVNSGAANHLAQYLCTVLHARNPQCKKLQNEVSVHAQVKKHLQKLHTLRSGWAQRKNVVCSTIGLSMENITNTRIF